MSKLIKFKEEATAKLLEGADQIKEAVAVTLGPRGNNVAIDREWGAPTVIHDGVSVAKEVDLEDKFANMGAQLMKEAAQKTNDVAGDGTTTAIILAHAILQESLKNIAAGQNAMVLRRGINKAVEHVVGTLQGMAKPIKTEQETTQVATISAQHELIGSLISKAIQKIGKDSVVTVEESGGTEIEVEYKEGMEFDRGMISPYFVTDQERMEGVVHDPYILVTDRTISDMQEFLPFLKTFSETPKERGNKLVIVASDVQGQALATLVLNKMKGTVEVIAVKAPGFGDKRRDQLEDMAILTGANFIGEDTGKTLANVTVDDLGHATRVTSTKDNTVIVGGQGIVPLIKARAQAIRNQLERSGVSEFDQEKLRERLAKLTSGVAVINVGANTEAEMKELKERAIDAISATKAALEEGVVPGGETALLRASYALEKAIQEADDEDRLGMDIVRRAIRLPFRRLLENAGIDASEQLPKFEKAEQGMGVDVTDGQLKNLLEAGIVDPVKVTRSALQNAASTAVMMMTTNVLITDAPKPKPETDQNAY